MLFRTSLRLGDCGFTLVRASGAFAVNAVLSVKFCPFVFLAKTHNLQRIADYAVRLFEFGKQVGRGGDQAGV